MRFAWLEMDPTTWCVLDFRWSELTVWPPGALVKHVKGLFKAEGINVTAEPGNGMHGRFFVSVGETVPYFD